MACAVFFQMMFRTDSIPLCGFFVEPEYFQLFSKVFDDVKQPCCIDQISLSSLCSNVNSKYPSGPVYISWKSWNELANEVGLSRIYGGIHWDNSNKGGLEIGAYVSRTLFDKINWQGMNLHL
jgi:hypothetical protein